MTRIAAIVLLLAAAYVLLVAHPVRLRVGRAFEVTVLPDEPVTLAGGGY